MSLKQVKQQNIKPKLVSTVTFYGPGSCDPCWYGLYIIWITAALVPLVPFLPFWVWVVSHLDLLHHARSQFGKRFLESMGSVFNIVPYVQYEACYISAHNSSSLEWEVRRCSIFFQPLLPVCSFISVQGAGCLLQLKEFKCLSPVSEVINWCCDTDGKSNAAPAVIKPFLGGICSKSTEQYMYPICY